MGIKNHYRLAPLVGQPPHTNSIPFQNPLIDQVPTLYWHNFYNNTGISTTTKNYLDLFNEGKNMSIFQFSRCNRLDVGAF